MNYKELMGYKKTKSNKVIDNIKEEFGYVNEGPAYEYANQISKIEILYDVYWDAVKDLGRTLEKKGLRKEAKQLYLTYRKQVSEFSQWFSKFSDGLM